MFQSDGRDWPLCSGRGGATVLMCRRRRRSSSVLMGGIRFGVRVRVRVKSGQRVVFWLLRFGLVEEFRREQVIN